MVNCLNGYSETVVLTKKEKQQQVVDRVKESFLAGIQNGEDTKDALINSFAAINEKYNPTEDCFVSYDGNIRKMKVGSSHINKDNVKFILEAIQLIVPMILDVLNWINKNSPSKPEEDKNIGNNN